MLTDKKYIDDIKSRFDHRRSLGWGLSYEDIEILIDIAEEAARYKEALQKIIEWGPIGGDRYGDVIAAATFQKIAINALEGKDDD